MNSLRCARRVLFSLLIHIFWVAAVVNASQKRALPKCDTVCGLELFEYPKYPTITRYPAPSFSPREDVEKCEGSSIKWGLKAQGFMDSIGLNEHFNCTTAARGLNLQQLPKVPTYEFPLMTILTVPEKDMEELSTLHSCYTQSYVYIRRHNLQSGRKDVLSLESNNLERRSDPLVFHFEDVTKKSLVPFRAKSSTGDNCTTDSSCKMYKSFVYGSDTYKHSMFENFTFTEIPGMSAIISNLEKDSSKVENIASDFSPSNIAIICLPLALSIPPISLMDGISGFYTIWYVIGTDVLSALPLLIKGIELIHVLGNSKVESAAASHTAKSEKSEITEQWEIHCYLKGFLRPRTGAIFISIAVWFMLTSAYVEFLFWRSVRFRKNLRRQRDPKTGGLSDVESKMPISSVGKDDGLDKNTTKFRSRWLRFLRKELWEGKRKFVWPLSILLFWAFFSSLDPHLNAQTSPFTWYSLLLIVLHLVVSDVAPVILVKRRLHGIGIWMISDCKFLNFLGFLFIGTVVGFLSGPLYFLVHVFEGVRKSEKWGFIGAGGNIGFSYALILIFNLTLGTPTNLIKTHTSPINNSSLFTCIYGISVIILRLIRWKKAEWKVRKFLAMSAILGLLCGPLGFFFRNIFPESRKKQNKSISSAIFRGCLYSNIFFVTCVVPFIAYIESIIELVRK